MGIDRDRRVAWAALAVALVAGAALRLRGSGMSPWFDEWASLFFAHQPLSRLWSGWMVRETNPPLYYTILRGWLLAAGPLGPVGARAPSIAAGLAAIALCWWGVGRADGPRAGAVAALLVAVSAQCIHFSQEVRAYAFLFLALAASFFALLDIVGRAERGERAPTRAWALFAGGAIAAGYLHTTALLWPPVATLALIAVRPDFRPFTGRDWRALALADLAIAAALGWWLWITWLQLRAPNANIAWVAPPGIREGLKIIAKGSLLLRGRLAATVLVLLPALVGAVRTRARATTRLTLACWLGLIAAFLAASRHQSIILERTAFPLTVFPLALAAAGLAGLPRRWAAVGTGGVVALLGINLVLARPGFVSEDWLGAVDHVAATPRAALLLSGEAEAVAADQACRLHRRTACPFPLLTLPLSRFDAWAHGLAPPTPSANGHPALPPGTRLYLLTRFQEDPLPALHGAGLIRAVRVRRAFLMGPLPPVAAAELTAGTRVKDGLVRLP